MSGARLYSVQSRRRAISAIDGGTSRSPRRLRRTNAVAAIHGKAAASASSHTTHHDAWLYMSEGYGPDVRSLEVHEAAIGARVAR
jgi:hypothetical protein